jgi:hypothetical protein
MISSRLASLPPIGRIQHQSQSQRSGCRACASKGFLLTGTSSWLEPGPELVEVKPRTEGLLLADRSSWLEPRTEGLLPAGSELAVAAAAAARAAARIAPGTATTSLAAALKSYSMSSVSLPSWARARCTQLNTACVRQ